jgi:PEGA domain
VRLLAFLWVLVLAAPAYAAEPAAPPPAARKVVVAPLSSLGEGGPDLGPVQSLVLGGMAGVAGVSVVPDKELRAAIKKAKRKELESCDGDAACLAELGKLVGAQVVVAGDVGELSGGLVAYLMAVDVASGKEMGSTTAVLSGDHAAKQAEARAAAFRLLSPAAYVGKLALSVDVTGATIYLDGKQLGRSPAGLVSTSVGTHALRVTHEQYRDFVRFIDVRFDATTKLDVNLKQFPIVSDRMVEQERRVTAPDGSPRPRPWYRQRWAVAAFGGVLLVATAITVGVLASGVDSDRSVTVGD